MIRWLGNRSWLRRNGSFEGLVYKKDNKRLATNWRPISLLNTDYKLASTFITVMVISTRARGAIGLFFLISAVSFNFGSVVNSNS